MSIVFQSADGQLTGALSIRDDHAHLPYVLSFNQRPDGKPLGFNAVSYYANDRVPLYFIKTRCGDDVKMTGSLDD